ncbi:hypothetical protein GMDG_02663 [Pseudogymnoascus destructans 20631-21]|uniref:Uncharacterized protein n=1 Tax=Pseudogymnoascus destructans (strain ATCC MYA-4855 / 20631-21) TaxID=658429 RepID=L8G313_PSED2|nr:hypothetical protein GMDG_02663 [Pseudogymnoascus destructans 20631-21]
MFSVATPPKVRKTIARYATFAHIWRVAVRLQPALLTTTSQRLKGQEGWEQMLSPCHEQQGDSSRRPTRREVEKRTLSVAFAHFHRCGGARCATPCTTAPHGLQPALPTVVRLIGRLGREGSKAGRLTAADGARNGHKRRIACARVRSHNCGGR